MAFRKVLGATAAANVVGGGYAYYWAKKNMGEDALDRIIKYDKVAVPMIVQYKWLEAKCEKLPTILPWLFPPVSLKEEQKQFEVLHRKFAQPLFDVFMELGGFYYKSGQKIASNMGGIVPKNYIDAFQPFLNDIPPRGPAEIRKILEESLGAAREEIFSEWDDTPIGCASIGQVHKARLRSSGKKVVVKVQNPEAERTFRGDVFALKIVVDTFMPQISVAFDEIQKQFGTEFDYRGEMQNAIDVRNNLEEGGFDHIIIPEVYPKYCSKRVLVMEEIYPATPLHDKLNEQAEMLAKEKGMTKEEFMDIEAKKMEEQAALLNGKMAESVSSDAYDAYIALQQGKRAVLNTAKRMYNWSVGWVFPNYDLSKDDVIVPLNAAKLIDQLFAVHGYETIINGCFNADPHPGNILCANGKLALIDYGQVKRVPLKDRLNLAKSILLVEAAIEVDPRTNPDVDPKVHKNARRSVAEHAKKIGMKTEKMLEDTLYQINVVYLGRMDKPFLYPDNALQWTDKMQSQDPMGNIDEIDYLVMVNMSSMMLRGLGEMLGQPRNVAVEYAPFCRTLLRQHGLLEAVEQEIKSWTQ
jgi:hypothetical protein